MFLLLFLSLLYLSGCIAVLLAITYVLYRIGRKFQIGTFWSFLVPVYNLFLLCDCAQISRWFSVGIFFPALVLLLIIPLGIFFMGPLIFLFKLSTPIVVFATNTYLWGLLRRDWGKTSGSGALASLFYAVCPILVLAFDDSMPVEETRYIG
jgi:hypothetical protein